MQFEPIPREVPITDDYTVTLELETADGSPLGTVTSITFPFTRFNDKPMEFPEFNMEDTLTRLKELVVENPSAVWLETYTLQRDGSRKKDLTQFPKQSVEEARSVHRLPPVQDEAALRELIAVCVERGIGWAITFENCMLGNNTPMYGRYKLDGDPREYGI